MKIPVLLLCVLTLALSIGCNVSATPETDSTKSNASGTQDSTASGNTAAKTLAEIVIEINSGNAVLIDVREQGEWDEKSFKMATLVPMSKINGQALRDMDLAGEKATKPTYTHCAKGFRAKKVADPRHLKIPYSFGPPYRWI